MRMLLPAYAADLDDAALDDAYAWPADRPWLRVNMVATADGAARSPDGRSRAISSDADRWVFGRLRGLADVILAGAGTVREENYGPARPRADFADRRAAAGQPPAAPLAVVTRSLSLDLTGPLFQEPATRTIVITCGSADRDKLARVREVADVIVQGEQDVDLRAAIADLHGRGLTRIHGEGGPHLLAELAAADLLDELQLTVSPKLAGGAYEDRTDVTRILTSTPLPGAPRSLRLVHLLEDEGSLFLRYLVADRSVA